MKAYLSQLKNILKNKKIRLWSQKGPISNILIKNEIFSLLIYNFFLVLFSCIMLFLYGLWYFGNDLPDYKELKKYNPNVKGVILKNVKDSNLKLNTTMNTNKMKKIINV